MKTQRNYGIDLFRIIAAFFVTTLHTNYGLLPVSFVEQIRISARWAVPFFFITSGFFIGKKITQNQLVFSDIQNTIVRIITILLVASIIYFPIAVYYFDFKITVESLLTGSYFHLWFIGSLLFAILFIWYFYAIKLQKVLPIVAMGVLAVVILSDSYDTLLNTRITFLRFMQGIPFVYIGIMLSKVILKQKHLILFTILAILGYCLQLFEVHAFFKYYDYDKSIHQLLIGTILFSVSLFLMSSLLPIKENMFSRWGKKYSLFIYLYHPLVYFGLNKLLKSTAPDFLPSIKVVYPLICFCITLTFAILLRNLSPRFFNLLDGHILNKKYD